MNKNPKETKFKQPDSIVGKIETLERKTKGFIRPAKSKIKVFPVNNRIIVKTVFTVPSAVVQKKEQILKGAPTYIEVVAYGCETDGIELGDKILISYHTSIEMLTFPANLRSVDSTQKRMMNALKGESFAVLNKMMVEMEEFYSVPIHGVTCIDLSGNVESDLNLIDAETGNV